jgi:hypothetical protein
VTNIVLVNGAGTDFAGAAPIQVTVTQNGSTRPLIVTQTVASTTQVQVTINGASMPAWPAAITFSDTSGSGASVTVSVAATPVLELIRENLVAALEQINQSSGYYTTPAVQELAAANGDSGNLIVVGLGESQLIKPPAQRVYWKQTFYAMCYVLADDASGAAIDPLLLSLFADVFAAVYVDRTRGGLAYDTVIQPPQFESNAEEAQFRVSIPIHVLYQTLENDPTLQG